MDICLTINSNLAVAIRVTGLEKSTGLSGGQSSGSGREVLQEQPGEDDQRETLSIYSKYTVADISSATSHCIFLRWIISLRALRSLFFQKISKTTLYSSHLVPDDLGFLNRTQSVWPQISKRLCLFCFPLCPMSLYTRGESWHRVARQPKLLRCFGAQWHHSEFRKMIPALQLAQRGSGWNLRDGAYFSSSSSMKSLLSWSMMAKTFLMSLMDLPDRPTLAKKSLWLKEPSAVTRQRRDRFRHTRTHTLTHRLMCVFAEALALVYKAGQLAATPPQPSALTVNQHLIA